MSEKVILFALFIMSVLNFLSYSSSLSSCSAVLYAWLSPSNASLCCSYAVLCPAFAGAYNSSNRKNNSALGSCSAVGFASISSSLCFTLSPFIFTTVWIV